MKTYLVRVVLTYCREVGLEVEASNEEAAENIALTEVDDELSLEAIQDLEFQESEVTEVHVKN